MLETGVVVLLSSRTSRTRNSVAVMIVARITTGQTMRGRVAAQVDVLQLAGVAANAMPPAELATSWLAPV